MGVETVLKVIIALVLIVVLGAAIAAIASAVSVATGAADAGIDYLVTESNFERDGDNGDSFTPVEAFRGMVALIYPGTGVNGISGDLTKGGWLVAMMVALPVALIAWLIVRWLIQLLLGGG